MSKYGQNEPSPASTTKGTVRFRRFPHNGTETQMTRRTGIYCYPYSMRMITISPITIFAATRNPQYQAHLIKVSQFLFTMPTEPRLLVHPSLISSNDLIDLVEKLQARVQFLDKQKKSYKRSLRKTQEWNAELKERIGRMEQRHVELQVESIDDRIEKQQEFERFMLAA